MTTIELTKSGIAMKKLRGDPEKYLNERRRDVLRYVEMKGSWPISQNWRKYGFTVAEIVGRIRKGGNEPNWEKLPIEFRVDENGIPLPDQFCVETQTSSGASEDTRVTMNIASSGRAVADMVRHNEQVVEEMEDFVRDLPPEETLISNDADNYRKFQGVMEENRGRQVNVNPEEIWTVVTINSYLHEKDDRGRLRVKTGDAKNDKFEESTVNIYVGKIGKPFSGTINTIITRYSRFDCRTDVRECYKDMKNLLENIRKDVDGKTGKKLTVVSAATKLNYCFALYFVAHHFKKDRENEGALEKLYPDQMDILEEERQKYVKLRDAGIAARKNIAIEAWANIKQKWLRDGGRLDIENVFFQLYEESVGRDDFGRVFVNPKVNIDSDQWGLGKNNFMTKDATTGDWTFHLNKYKTYKKYKSVKILWRGEKAKLIDDWLKKSGNETFLFEKNKNIRTRKPTAYGTMSQLIGKKLKQIGVVNKERGQNINYLRHSYASTNFDWEYFRRTNKSREDISYTMQHSPSMNAEYVRPLVDITESIRGDERETIEEEDIQDSNFVIPEESIPDYIPVSWGSTRKRSRVRQRGDTETEGQRRKR